MILMSLCLYAGIGAWFRHINKRRAAGLEDHKAEGMSREEIAEMGEHNPEYRYTW